MSVPVENKGDRAKRGQHFRGTVVRRAGTARSRGAKASGSLKSMTQLDATLSGGTHSGVCMTPPGGI